MADSNHHDGLNKKIRDAAVFFLSEFCVWLVEKNMKKTSKLGGWKLCDVGVVDDCDGTCGGSAVVDCAGTCGGSAVVDCAGTWNITKA